MQLVKGEKIQRYPPKTIYEELHSIFHDNYNIHHDDFYAVYFQDTFIHTSHGWLLTKDRDFLVDSLASPAFIHKRDIQKITFWPALTTNLDEAILCYSHWAVNNYYHWMLEVLPRLSPIITPDSYPYLGQIAISGKILLPPNPLPWMYETLDLLDVNHNRLHVTDGRQLYAKNLLFLSSIGKPMNTPRWAIDWLNDSLNISSQQVNGNNQKKYLISRQLATKRKIVNESELEKALIPYGFQRVVLEELSILEQISLFRDAGFVIAPHGAGITNIIFSNNATLIEIFEPSWFWPTYYGLCQDCGHSYWYYVGETTEECNIHVEIPKIMEIIDLALGN